MRLPVLTRATKFGERQADRGSGPVGVEPQDCSLPKKIACAGAVAACAAVCIGTGGAGAPLASPDWAWAVASTACNRREGDPASCCGVCELPMKLELTGACLP